MGRVVSALHGRLYSQGNGRRQIIPPVLRLLGPGADSHHGDNLVVQDGPDHQHRGYSGVLNAPDGWDFGEDEPWIMGETCGKRAVLVHTLKGTGALDRGGGASSLKMLGCRGR